MSGPLLPWLFAMREALLQLQRELDKQRESARSNQREAQATRARSRDATELTRETRLRLADRRRQQPFSSN
jgi:hypothetical protein